MPWMALSLTGVGMNISLSGQAVVLFAFLPLLAWAGNHHVVTVPGGDVHNNPGCFKILQSLREESGRHTGQPAAQFVEAG